MNRIKFTFYCATISVLLMSCSQYIPFTGKVQEKYRLSENDLKQLQFYTSKEIVLYQASNDADAAAFNGELVVNSDREVNRVLIPKGTPGTVVYVYPDKLAVTFENEENRNLLFGSKYIDGEYRLLAREWDNKHGELKFGDQLFIAAPGSGDAYLLIKLKQLQKTEVKDEVLRGRKVTKAY